MVYGNLLSAAFYLQKFNIMKNFVLLVLIMAIGLSGFRTNDTRTITGTVISIDDNLPIPGATVKVKGTTIGTQTTTIGKFSLKVP